MTSTSIGTSDSAAEDAAQIKIECEFWLFKNQ